MDTLVKWFTYLHPCEKRNAQIQFKIWNIPSYTYDVSKLLDLFYHKVFFTAPHAIAINGIMVMKGSFFFVILTFMRCNVFEIVLMLQIGKF